MKNVHSQYSKVSENKPESDLGNFLSLGENDVNDGAAGGAARVGVLEVDGDGASLRKWDRDTGLGHNLIC